MTDIIKLDARLMLAASLVSGNCVADIGTDHAYIPIYLLQSGKCSRAIAADINKGPLENAMENAKQYNLFEKITFALCDGLSAIDLSGVSDIVICGMGGELIAGIIENCPELKQKNAPRLVLQPMSAIEDLRLYLAKEGFEICDGGVAEAGGKIYQCFAAVYTGVPYTLTPAELIVGAENEKIRNSPLFPALLEKYINRCQKEIKGRKMGRLDTKELEGLLFELRKTEKSLQK